MYLMIMKKKETKLKEQIYNTIIEYRPTIITAVIIMIPIIMILYILNLHHYIFPSILENKTVFRLDIYYRYFLYILAFMHFYELFYKKKKLSMSDIFLYIFMIFIIISTIFAYNKTYALYGYPRRYEGMYTLLFYCFLYLNGKELKNRNFINQSIKIILGTALIHFILVILQLTGLYSTVIYKYTSGDAIGLTENCNFLGSLMCMLSIIASSLFIFKENNKNFPYLILFILTYTCLLLASSTGPFISFIITFILIIIYVLFKKRTSLKKMAIVLLLICILYPIVLIKNDEITPEIKSHLNYIVNIFKDNKTDYLEKENLEIEDNVKDDDDKELSFNELGHGRMRIWKNVFKSIRKRPFLGYGSDNLGLIYEKEENENLIADKAHNIYLHIWVSNGILALIGYLSFVIINIIKGFKSKNNLAIVLCFGIIAYSIQGIFNINVNEVTPYFYIIISFIASLSSEKEFDYL